MLKDVSLTTVKAFEAAARHGSFRAAASELNLSPSAVSHAILKLEQSLGTPLFERDGRSVRLSPGGEMLMRYVGTAFDELRRGMEIVSNRKVTLLRLHSAPSFAAQWLTPRLSDFLARNPDIEVRLASNTDYARFSNDDFDIDIVYGPPRVEGLHVIPHMRQRKGGSIACMSSVSAQRGGGIFGGPHYSAAKAGVLGLAKAMAREFGPDNIRVNCITPGLIMTDITGGKLTPEMKTDIIKGIPIGRLGEAKDVAGAYLFLASDLSSYITGAVIDVNGGMLIHG